MVPSSILVLGMENGAGDLVVMPSLVLRGSPLCATVCYAGKLSVVMRVWRHNKTLTDWKYLR